jgi:hypothetical protein
MEDCQQHHAGLDDAKALKKMDAVSHGEGGQNVDDESHRVEDMQMGLKHLVLELSTELRC